MHPRPGSQIHFLLEALSCAPSADNSQPWCVDWDGRTLKAFARTRGGFPLDYHATLLALGAAAENLSQALGSLGLEPSAWQMGPPDDLGCFIAGFLENPDAVVADQATRLWQRRHTNRWPYSKEPLAGIAPLLAPCRVGTAGAQVLTGDAYRRAASWVKRASAIRFRTREVHEWFGQSLRFGQSGRDGQQGLHVSTLNLPPGGGALLRFSADWENMALLNRVGLYKVFALIESVGFKQAPCALAIVGPEGRAGAFQAGRILERAWLAVTRQGWAAHPFYVVSDMLYRYAIDRVPQELVGVAQSVYEEVTEFAGAGNTLHCLLRVGVPTRSVPRAGRLSLNNILCNASE